MADYREHPPRADLKGRVRCVWTFEGRDADADQRIAPDGCAELIVHFGAPYLERGRDGMAAPQPGVLVAGQLTRPLHIRAAGLAGVVAVRFQPAGAWAFVGRPMQTVTDRRVALEALHGAAAAALVRAVKRAHGAEARLQLVQDYVADQIARRPRMADPTIEACVDALAAAEGRLTLPDLQALSGLQPRQLQRRFLRTVGVPARTLAAILRFRRVFEALQEPGVSSWSQAAQAAGYFDHPQLAREVRRFLGCTPSQFLASARGLATSLVEPGQVANVQAAARAGG